MNQITLHRDDLEAILKIVDSINPADDTCLASGTVTIISENESGIGSIISMKTRIDINGLSGEFCKVICDQTSW